MAYNSVEIKEMTSFQEFVQFAFPDIGLENPLDQYIFRGQSEDWPLLPSFLRDGVIEKLVNQGTLFKEMHIDEGRLIQAEMNLIRDFYKHADFEGVNVPEIAELREKITEQFWFDLDSEMKNLFHGAWIPENLHEITALAQHYGMPTRLLDWSYSLPTALLFAATGLINQYGMLSKELKDIYLDKFNSQKKFFVIWALDIRHLAEKSNGLIKLVQPIYTRNSNLTAQKGLFTLRQFRSMQDDKIVFDEFVNENVTSEDPYLKQKRPALIKFKIPQRDVIETTCYLERLGLTEKSLFPGLSGVVNFVKRIKNL